MKIPLNDPRYKLVEIPFEQTKERRQKKFNENRAIKNQEEIKETTHESMNNKQITKLVKQVTYAEIV